MQSPELAERMAHLGAYVGFAGSLDMSVRVLAAMTVNAAEMAPAPGADVL